VSHGVLPTYRFIRQVGHVAARTVHYRTVTDPMAVTELMKAPHWLCQTAVSQVSGLGFVLS
jgi:hypothetical protein